MINIRNRLRFWQNPGLLWFGLVLLASIGTCVNSLDLPGSGPRLARLGNGASFLDMRFYYSSETATHFVAAIGPAGRASCLFFYSSWDLVIPLFAWLWSTAAIEYLYRLYDSRRWLRLLPLAACAFDLSENISIALLVCGYRNPSPFIASLAGAVTALKWATYAATVLCLAAGFFRRTRLHEPSLTSKSLERN